MLQRPAQNPMKLLYLPVVLQFPAHCPAKKLSIPVPPVPLIQLVIFLVPHTLNAPATVSGEPLILNPEASTLSLSVVPAANITVLHNPAVPNIDPMIKLLEPVVTAHPALQPINVLTLPVVLFLPALVPKKILYSPVVLLIPA